MENDKLQPPHVLPEWITQLAEEARTGSFSRYFPELTEPETYLLSYNAAVIFENYRENAEVKPAETIEELEAEARAEWAKLKSLKLKSFNLNTRKDVTPFQLYTALFWSVVLDAMVKRIKNLPDKVNATTPDEKDTTTPSKENTTTPDPKEQILKMFLARRDGSGGSNDLYRTVADAVPRGDGGRRSPGSIKSLYSKWKARPAWITSELIDCIINELEDENKPLDKQYLLAITGRY